MENFSKTSLMREAVAQRCSVKKVFLEISQTSQENTCVRVSFLIRSFFIKKDTLVQVFPVNFAKFLRTPSLTSGGCFCYATYIIATKV